MTHRGRIMTKAWSIPKRTDHARKKVGNSKKTAARPEKCSEFVGRTSAGCQKVAKEQDEHNAPEKRAVE